VTETLDPSLVVPAPGQGALAIECRAEDASTREVLAALSDAETEIAVACERGAMKAVGGSCKLPFGAYASRRGRELRLSAMLANPDGADPRRVERVVAWPETPQEAASIGFEAGRSLLP
jgi:hydroxymethylbilane synthase